MKIATNLSSLITQNQFSKQNLALSDTLQKLSSGLRINSAKDDAAGLAISNRMTTNIREANQAVRNANDGLSMAQVAEGTLGSITDDLHRLRSLTMQAASGINGDTEKGFLQGEATKLIEGINQKATETTYNGISLFKASDIGLGGDADKNAVIEGLTSYWISEAETLIRDNFGLQGTNIQIDVNLDFTDGKGGTAASVQPTNLNQTTGVAGGITLNIDMADFTPPNLPNGGEAPLYNDRIVAHEMVHAVMAANMYLGNLPGWFVEGTAEFIHGADERVSGDLLALNPALTQADITTQSGAAQAAALALAQFHDTTPGSPTTSAGYSAGYIAVRVLHDDIVAAGGNGVSDVLSYLRANPVANLDAALTSVAGGLAGLEWSNLATFNDHITGGGGGYTDSAAAAYILGAYDVNDTGDSDGDFADGNAGIDLFDTDTGSIAGSEYGGGALTAESVLPNDASAGSAQFFTLSLPDTGTAEEVTQSFRIGLGVDLKNRISIDIGSADADTLNLTGLDITNTADALERIDAAMNYVTGQRANLGAIQSRLESSMSNLNKIALETSGARSRIRDADFAKETSTLTKQQILTQASSSILAQANNLPQAVIALLS